MFTRSVAALVAVLALAGCGAPAQETPPGVALPADSIVTDTGHRADEPLAKQPPASNRGPPSRPPPNRRSPNRVSAAPPVARPVDPKGGDHARHAQGERFRPDRRRW